MGKITAHRAWTTIASALYNPPEGLKINTGEFGPWLIRTSDPLSIAPSCIRLGWQIDCKGKLGQTRIHGSFKFW